MHSALSQQIQCPICLNHFKDPVCLPCEHSFCRGCITRLMECNPHDLRCPECRGPFSQHDVRTSRLLRNMVYATRAHLEEHEALKKRVDMIGTAAATPNRDSPELICPKHNEPFKLFCETDQKLICFICREENVHQGHKFKTMNDAAKIKKAEANAVLKVLFSEDEQLTDMSKKQHDEMSKTKSKSEFLEARISAQFAKMHKFLTEREGELKKTLRENEQEVVGRMEQNVRTMEELLSDGKEEQGTLVSALETDKPDSFLKWWSEQGNRMVEGMLNERIKPKLENVSVISDCLSLGPYETYLQFFAWKEMLRTVNPIPRRLTMKDNDDACLKVSPSGRFVQRSSKKGKFSTKKYNMPFTSSAQSFRHGQHYWEVEVGEKLSWVVGVSVKEYSHADTVLYFSSEEGYYIIQYGSGTAAERALTGIEENLRKIGVCLDCERNQVSFYNAEGMTLIDVTECDFNSPHSLCVSPGLYHDGKNSDPVTLCWY
ncbi:nuclear factor 7, brain-like [Chanos chanos]|uniref:Nuclear factor 7, brain-like n=1 Tax=Chanos chanos TaxID=29144 RepID=A0A6J2W7F8_CHACN|nr:nuclear factor 7, brain-like [Chanos chanos]